MWRSRQGGSRCPLSPGGSASINAIFTMRDEHAKFFELRALLVQPRSLGCPPRVDSSTRSPEPKFQFLPWSRSYGGPDQPPCRRRASARCCGGPTAGSSQGGPCRRDRARRQGLLSGSSMWPLCLGHLLSVRVSVPACQCGGGIACVERFDGGGDAGCRCEAFLCAIHYSVRVGGECSAARQI